jgi:ligand-binding sensor domain-containing protein
MNLQAPQGAVVKAGKGRVVKAGVGVRQGSWLTLGVSDGLPSSVIFAILQDRAGYLWFGGRGGVSRYDGEQFVTFTTADGLASNDVRAIWEDRAGYLSFLYDSMYSSAIQ